MVNLVEGVAVLFGY